MTRQSIISSIKISEGEIYLSNCSPLISLLTAWLLSGLSGSGRESGRAGRASSERTWGSSDGGGADQADQADLGGPEAADVGVAPSAVAAAAAVA